MNKISLAVIAAFVVAMVTALGAQAQSARTLDELKAEAQSRADRNAYPLNGLHPDDVREALGRLKSLDRDEWAASWSQVGDRYMAKKQFHEAWLYYSFARWPVPNSPGKQQAYEKALEAYRGYAKRFDPPLEVLRVPYEGSEVVGYLRLPKGAKPAPLIVAIAGLDSRKEDMAERFAPLVDRGVALLALDSPGTGQSGVKAAVATEKSLSAMIDAALRNPRIDAKRIALYGGSLGGYWATILAITERTRLRAVVAQSPPVHEYFSRERTYAALKNKEYLFDYVPAHMFTYGASNIDQLAELKEKLSLKTRGMLTQPMAPMLVIGGALDTQVPIADIDLLMRSGDSPKQLWVHPKGGHMGRDRHAWPDPAIFQKVTTPWLLGALEVEGP
ncbi:MAG TPA: alpha/beta fold hydrolase [Burkholderiales bacterium]